MRFNQTKISRVILSEVELEEVLNEAKNSESVCRRQTGYTNGKMYLTKNKLHLFQNGIAYHTRRHIPLRLRLALLRVHRKSSTSCGLPFFLTHKNRSPHSAQDDTPRACRRMPSVYLQLRREGYYPPDSLGLSRQPLFLCRP